MEGTIHQTPAYFYESAQEGPNVMILGGTHGDEPAGYEAALRLLEQFRKSPPVSGKIILVPLANRVAVENYNRRVAVDKGADREKGNLNRCYPGDPAGHPIEKLAYQIQQLVIENNIEVLIDLHEARRSHLKTDTEGEEKGLGQTIIYQPNEVSTWLVMVMLDHINEKIDNQSIRFSSLERPIKNSAAWWAGETLNIAAFTFETSRSLKIEQRIQFHLQLVKILLQEKGIF
jgi:succinylglutamate desuccinylase